MYIHCTTCTYNKYRYQCVDCELHEGYLEILEPDCEALDSIHAIVNIPDQQVECSVGEETLVCQVVLFL